MSGPHTLEDCASVTAMALSAVYSQCQIQGIQLSGTILKPNMVLPGTEAPPSSADEVARATSTVLNENVPSDVAGIAFLSGGQSDFEATLHLNQVNQLSGNSPWPLTFSYGRALLADALGHWSKSQVKEAQSKLHHRSKMNGLASTGQWEESLEK